VTAGGSQEAAVQSAAPVSIGRPRHRPGVSGAGGGVTRVIDRVSLSFDQAGINMLLGPSGCGKSTLLHMLGGVRPMGVSTPTSGSVLIDGVECHGAARRRGDGFPALCQSTGPDGVRQCRLPVPAQALASSGAEAEWRRVADILKAVGLSDKRGLRRRSSPAARTSAWRWRGRWSCGRASC
jgi:ABC-type multidrug transport system ATPase subunit